MVEPTALQRLLEATRAGGGLQTDDVLTLALPLLREVAALHEQGRVAALHDAAAYQMNPAGVLQLAQPQGATPRHQRTAVEALQQSRTSVLRVVGEQRVTQDGEAGTSWENLQVAAAPAPGDAPPRPAYVPGYIAWEHGLGHHDTLSDILCLGQVLASLALGLDFCAPDDLRRFAEHRGNLFRLHARLHPVLAAVIVEMTALDRHQRARDLPSVIQRLETYREQPLPLDMARLAGADTPAGAGPHRRAVQEHLRDRLFDLSRRNRLLHFRPTQSSINLTVASVPLVLDRQSIKLDALCTWEGRFAQEVLAGRPVPLARWLRFEDQPYLPPALDRILLETRRDLAEYGFSQLRLVLVFLRWHNFKEDRHERIVSPLLLLPVTLTRRKGVRDQYLLEAGGTEAEVNPALRQQLRQSYGIELPERVDLAAGTLHELHAWLSAQIAASEPGVQLRWLDQPEIDLIHQRAVQRLEQFRRRQRVPAPAAAVPALPVATAGAHSYQRDDFRPLGLQLFRERVSPSPLPLRGAVGALPATRHPQMTATVPPPTAALQVEHATYALRESAGNPYQWDFDLSAVTLGNFNYRKMSLVRDYSALIEDDQPNPAFDRVFSAQPRPTETPAPAPLPWADSWAVVAADATQAAAVALARSGASYIIQGPPGTGKSQTITNLIADHVGRGRRVLFVCEKRAAIDVVFHRLRQLGLDELCCMIHDSQADKKAFVQNLRQTYGQWLEAPDTLDEIQRQRQAVLGTLEQDLQALQRFDTAMRSAPPHVGLPVRELVARLAAVRAHEPALTPREAEALPDHAVWRRHADLARRLHQALLEHTGQGLLSAHPFATLGPAVLRHERPLNRMAGLIERAEQLLQRCTQVLGTALPAHAQDASLGELLALVDHARRLAGIAAHDQLDLLDPHSEPSRQWDMALAQWEVRTQTLAKCAQLTLNWRDKLPAAEAQAALVQARQQELGLLRWLRPSWWRLHGDLQRRYDFTRHATPPPLSRVLADLISEQRAQAACGEIQEQLRVRHGCDDVPAFAAALRALREDTARQPLIAELHGQGLSAPPEPEARQRSLAQLAATEREALALAEVLGELLIDAQAHTVQALTGQVLALGQAADALPALLPLLQELAEADPGVAQRLRSTPWPPDALEAAIARAALERVVRSEPGMARFDADALARHTQRLAESERELMHLNAQSVRAAVHRRFADQVRRSSMPAGQLDAAGKQFKKTYSAGRRELEHEFGKTMRYKSIRELAGGDSGRVVRDMKPIWLMSPLSVSDSLPLEADLFDVVIFDEASQIPVEEAVPALVRAPQVIVVGDEMQLPPTSFFASAREDGDDEAVEAEEDGERIAVMLDADSLLNQGARNLPATLLAWHYRSRSESLIGYSNAAFYAGLLHTVPERRLPAPGLGEIHVTGAEGVAGVATQADALLARPISVHLVAGAVYAQRRNEAEARHIAGLVRELLARETGQSLGIVAFSQAQQAEIESALDALAAQDPVFAARLEAESQREHEDQFVGLFVKNLENVQGDERDIVILSICYGPGPDGRMLMNFGPINQRGGEKRLNVIFSRARQHMAVVTSIPHEAITNEHNDGAAALKHFLRYAEHLSRGDTEAAQRVLGSLNPLARRSLAHETAARDVVRAQLAQALRERGHAVDERVGQSRFRCDLAIRAAGGRHYALGILLDTSGDNDGADVFERHVSRPRILAGFGWRCVQVLGRDWVDDPGRVVEWVERALGAGAD
jgi:hypothetical protein